MTSTTDGWQFTDDLDVFLDRADECLRAEPALNTVLLSVGEALRGSGVQVYGEGAPLFGTLTVGGAVRGAFLRTPPHRLVLGVVSEEAAAALAARLAATDACPGLPGVTAVHATAEAFATEWSRRTGTTTVLHRRERLYRLGTPTPPEPAPAGRARPAAEGDRELLARWYGAFGEAIGEAPGTAPESWAEARIAQGGVTLWETDGVPVAMASATPRIAGQVRIATVYTPPELRGRGYAGAATTEAGRAARAAGADEVLLFTDLANPTSNALYRRIGYRPVRDFASYAFTATAAP
ncbi:GNAT family N-acetyltransferase [Streptomyces sp. NPDC002004]